MFETALWRFATAGTLIACYGIADHVARRRERDTPKPLSPRWLRPLVIASVTGFYLLIGPAGGPLIGGLGNLAGIGLAVGAMSLRLSRVVWYPDLAGRALFYSALPIAAGVPWGLLVLSLPALAASFYCCHRADQFRGQHEDRDPRGLRTRYRLLPGIW